MDLTTAVGIDGWIVVQFCKPVSKIQSFYIEALKRPQSRIDRVSSSLE